MMILRSLLLIAALCSAGQMGQAEPRMLAGKFPSLNQAEDAGNRLALVRENAAARSVGKKGGKAMGLEDLGMMGLDLADRCPFSFTYRGIWSDELLGRWKVSRTSEKLDQDRSKMVTTWTDPQSGLRIIWTAIRYSDFPAVEWLLHFENSGRRDTDIIESVQAMDVTFNSPMAGVPYRLHRTHGGSADPMQFEPSVVPVDAASHQVLHAGSGRSSSADFPFFKIEMAGASIVVAVGWSGCWQARFECPNGRQLRITAGMEQTHFLLHPGERVRSPRILLLYWPGDTLEANAQFRQLIYKHYAAKWKGNGGMPVLFCNTCFTRGGGWLNECNEQNQVSLIKAYAPLGLEALITDAGWFEGGWPAGAGNWNPRKDAYPRGMAPVARAAKERKMVYGLWFEPERVVSGTELHRKHPEWCLASQKDPQDTYLLNFGLQEVREYFFQIIKGFMALPGFRVYRQDFNMDPLPYWRFNDAPDRQGITEIKYIEGLYAFWDSIAKAWPDSLREECASGGNRIDLETVMRFHMAQKTDYWFHNEVDQAALWGVSQYLPNNCIVAHVNRMDEYSFHSEIPSSLCVGWIADAPEFDSRLAKKLLDRYLSVRHLLVGAWYPLLPYSRNTKDWIASQYHRPDLDQGMILLFRRAESPRAWAEVSLHGLQRNATYELSFQSSGQKLKAKGSELMGKFTLTLTEPAKSELILYRKVSR